MSGEFDLAIEKGNGHHSLKNEIRLRQSVSRARTSSRIKSGLQPVRDPWKHSMTLRSGQRLHHHQEFCGIHHVVERNIGLDRQLVVVVQGGPILGKQGRNGSTVDFFQESGTPEGNQVADTRLPVAHQDAPARKHPVRRQFDLNQPSTSLREQPEQMKLVIRQRLSIVVAGHLLPPRPSRLHWAARQRSVRSEATTPAAAQGLRGTAIARVMICHERSH